VIIGIGEQDVTTTGLRARHRALRVMRATSDHTIMAVPRDGMLPEVGAIIEFLPSYSGLLRLFMSPYVAKSVVS
jgi:predicted amino acid racemase